MSLYISSLYIYLYIYSLYIYLLPLLEISQDGTGYAAVTKVVGESELTFMQGLSCAGYFM